MICPCCDGVGSVFVDHIYPLGGSSWGYAECGDCEGQGRQCDECRRPLWAQDYPEGGPEMCPECRINLARHLAEDGVES